MKKWMLFCIGFALYSCGPEPIPDPGIVQLVAPKNLDLCTTADKLNDSESQVKFVWNAALNTDDYELVIRNQRTGIFRDYVLTNTQTINKQTESYRNS